MERLNKYISSCGICSRRKADELIENGKVEVNGVLITNLGEKVEDSDVIKVNGKKISKEIKKVYIALNKPKGYVTTNSDQFGRKNVTELIKEDVRVYPVGRLDMYTEGLLILTNDGYFSNKMMHPKNEINKTYIVSTSTNVTEEQIRKLQEGVDIGDYITKPAMAQKLDKNKLEIIIHEGKNRQVRRMCEAVGINLLNLKRAKIGIIELGTLQTGKYRYLTKDEIESIK